MFSPARLTAASQGGSPEEASSSFGTGERAQCKASRTPPFTPVPAPRGSTYPRDATRSRFSGDQRHLVAPGSQELREGCPHEARAAPWWENRGCLSSRAILLWSHPMQLTTVACRGDTGHGAAGRTFGSCCANCTRSSAACSSTGPSISLPNRLPPLSPKFNELPRNPPLIPSFQPPSPTSTRIASDQGLMRMRKSGLQLPSAAPPPGLLGVTSTVLRMRSSCLTLPGRGGPNWDWAWLCLAIRKKS